MSIRKDTSPIYESCKCYTCHNHIGLRYVSTTMISCNFTGDLPSSFAMLTGGTVIREEVGLSLDNVGKHVIGHALKVVLTKDTNTIVGDGSTQEAVNKRVAQRKNTFVH